MSGSNLIRVMTLGIGLFAALASTASVAAGVSGDKNLICDASHVVGCTDGMCMQGTPGTFDLVHFMFVDFAKKQIHGVDEDGREAFSPIRNTESTDKAIILLGFENHRGWIMGVDRETGGLTMSVTGADVNFILSGNCIER